MNILLFANIGTWYNKYYHVGDEAMFLATLAWYRNKWPECNISDITSLPNHQDKHIQGFIHPLPLTYYRPLVVIKLAVKSFLLYHFHRNFFNRYEKTLLKIIQSQDIIHLTGGGHLNSLFTDWLYYSLTVIAIAKGLHKKVYITSHTLGPFYFPDLLLTSFFLNQVDHIIVREPLNFLSRFKHLLFFTKFNGHLDAAYFLTAHQFKIPQKKHLRIGLSLHEWQNNQSQVDSIIAALKTLSLSQKIEIVLIPHIIIKSRHEHDSYFMKMVTQKLKNITIIPLTLTNLTQSSGEPAEKINYATSTCDLLITTRYHGLIFALSNSIPCFCLYKDKYYQQKFTGAFQLTYTNKHYLPFLINSKNIPQFISNLRTVIQNLSREKKYLQARNKQLKVSYNFPCSYIYEN